MFLSLKPEFLLQRGHGYLFLIHFAARSQLVHSTENENDQLEKVFFRLILFIILNLFRLFYLLIILQAEKISMQLKGDSGANSYNYLAAKK